MPKISQRPAQSGAAVADGDLIGIIDVGSPNLDERITVAEFAQAPQFSSRYAPRATAADAIFVDAHSFRGYAGSPTIGTQQFSGVFLLDSGTQESLCATVTVPSDWTTCHFDLWWSNAGAGAGNVRLTTGVHSIANAGSIAGTTIVTVTDTVTAPAQDVLTVTRRHTGFTVPASRTVLLFVVRVGNNADDTLGNDMSLLGVRLVRES